MSASPLRRTLRAAAGFLLLGTALCLAAMKGGAIEARPAWIAGFGVALALLLVPLFAAAGTAFVRGPRRLAGLAEALVAAGVLAVDAAGLANWGLGVQGFLILFEREPVGLASGRQGIDLALGPLASRRDIDVTVALGRLRLVPAGRDGFLPESRIRVLDAAGEEVGLDVGRGRPAVYRNLVFRQGAFGFAPRLIVLSGGRTLHDDRVAFRTIKEGPRGIAFLGELELPGPKVKLRGAVSLEDLDDEMKGHPRLEVALERDGEPLGAGTLAPGEFADLKDGYRIGFAGLRRWVEIDVSRRTYRRPLLFGLALVALGGALWPIAAWRRA